MDPRDHPRPLPDGATCTACGASVPTGRIRTLARRDDLAFVELDCAECGSSALGMVTASASPHGAPVLDVDSDVTARGMPGRGGTFRSISLADVEAIRDDLAAWQGDLVGWLDSVEHGGRGSVVDR
jgi:hypothetical protein